MTEIDIIQAYLAQQPYIIVAYLFGSRATGQARPDSDIDIAVLLDELGHWEQFEERLHLITKLELLVHKKVDVVVLNHASPLLAQQVLTQKRLLFERDVNKRIEFEVTAGKIYADIKPMYEFFWQNLLKTVNSHDPQPNQWRSSRTLKQARKLLE